MNELSKAATPARVFAPAEIALVAVLLARDNGVPQLFFPKAVRLLSDAESYLAEGVGAILNYARTPSQLAMLIAKKPVGWPEMLRLLDQAVWKHPGRKHHPLTRMKVERFLKRTFTKHVVNSPDTGEPWTLGDLFIQWLDCVRLPPDHANAIADRWRVVRKAAVANATAARSSKAAEQRIPSKRHARA